MIGQDTDSTRASTITLIVAFIIAGMFLIADRGSERLLSKTTNGTETGLAPALALLSKPLRAMENVVIEILGANPGIDIPAKKIAARAVSEINGPFVRSALINVGTNKGIEKGHPVMTVHGLYGHVLRSGPYSARVLQLGDLNSRISVMSARSGARAILSGDNSDMPLLAFVEDRANWRESDQVLSSGDDGVLPQGLPIGEVKSNDVGQFVVMLGTTGKPTDWVWVYPYAPTEEPQDIIELETDKETEDVGEVSTQLPEAGVP